MDDLWKAFFETLIGRTPVRLNTLVSSHIWSDVQVPRQPCKPGVCVPDTMLTATYVQYIHTIVHIIVHMRFGQSLSLDGTNSATGLMVRGGYGTQHGGMR